MAGFARMAAAVLRRKSHIFSGKHLTVAVSPLQQEFVKSGNMSQLNA